LRTLTSSEIKARARALGFDLCGIAPAGSFPELSFLREWLDRGHAGEMGYLQRTADKRADVRHVLPGARSVIVTGTIYNIARPYSTEQADPDAALISRYAWGDDYHDVLKARLDALVAWMRDASPEPPSDRGCSSPKSSARCGSTRIRLRSTSAARARCASTRVRPGRSSSRRCSMRRAASRI
jgi:epoxyqueuosine reductase